MPITITDVAANFQLVCQYARERKQSELAQLIQTTIKTVNFVYCLETPIERLAFEGDDKAVQFLLNNFNGNIDYALRGYARANNVFATEAIIRLGTSLNYAIMGYAYVGNKNAVDTLIDLGADKNWAVVGYAHGYNNNNNKNIINNILYPGIKPDEVFEDSPYHQDVLNGLARGGHVEVVDNFFRQFRRDSVYRTQAKSTLMFSYALVNNISEVYRWIFESGGFDCNNALNGFLSGGHFSGFVSLYTSFNVTPASIVNMINTVSVSQHIMQTNELIDLCIASGFPPDKIIYEALYGFVSVNNIPEISLLISRYTVSNLCLLKAYSKTYNYSILESFYKFNENNLTIDLIKQSFIAVDAQEQLANAQKSDAYHVYGLAFVKDDNFRNTIIECTFPSEKRPSIFQLSKKMADRIKQGQSYYESKDDVLNHLIDKYHFSIKQTRAGFINDIHVYRFFMRIVPGLIKIFDKDFTWIILSFLLPTTWGLTITTDNKLHYGISPVLNPKDMLDFANKMSAAARFLHNVPFKVNKKRKATTQLEQIESESEVGTQTMSKKKEEDSTPVLIEYSNRENSDNVFKLLVGKNIFIHRERIVILPNEEKQTAVSCLKR
jgi:hypothetical protein